MAVTEKSGSIDFTFVFEPSTKEVEGGGDVKPRVRHYKYNGALESFKPEDISSCNSYWTRAQ